MALPPLPPNAALRYDIVRRQLHRMHGLSSILEIGAGQGAFAARLARLADYTGIEPDDTSRAVAETRLPSEAKMLASTDSLSPTVAFDLVCSFEVVEHLEDDAGTLAQWTRRCRPGGWLMISVPAQPHRLGAWDERVGHYRRYDREQLRRLVAGLGFVDIQADHYGFPLGYVLEAGRNAVARHRPATGAMDERTAGSGRTLQPGGSRWGILAQVATAPFALAQRPFRQSRMGTGLVVSARRSAGS